MVLKDAIDAFDTGTRLSVAVPRQNHLTEHRLRLEKLASGLDTPDLALPPDVVDTVANKLRSGEWPDRRALKLVCMGGLPSLEALDDGRLLVAQLIEKVKESAKSTLVKAVLIGYLHICDQDNWLTQCLRQFLQETANQLPRYWLEAVETFRFLDKPLGQMLGDRILNHKEVSPGELLVAARLKGALQSRGFSQCVFEQVCKRLSAGHNRGSLGRFWEYVESNGIIFPNELSLYCEALLNPYVEDSPDEVIRTDVERFLISHFDDPRLNPDRWIDCPHNLLDVIKRWLTQQSIELMFQVLDRSNDTGQWAGRAEFWNYYLENDHVSEAWVVFGPMAHAQAKQLIREGTLKAAGSFAVLQRQGVQSMHSMLLMRIGDFVISEWTHDGKVRFYRRENKYAPKFYQPSYSPDRIRLDRNADVNIIHTHDSWQSKVENQIYEMTGILGPSRAPRNRRLGAKSRINCCICGKPKTYNQLDSLGRCGACRGLKVRSR